MALETSRRGSRRALLAGAVGAAIATVASSLGRAGRVDAANGAPVLVGGSHQGTTVTSIQAGASAATAAIDGQSDAAIGIQGRSTTGEGVRGTSQSGPGVYGYSTSMRGVVGGSESGDAIFGFSSAGRGVYGSSQTNFGVHGTSDSNIALLGGSGSHTAVWGITSATDKPSIMGVSAGASTGVHGYSGGSIPPDAPVRTGVYGTTESATPSVGVRGDSGLGGGVVGFSGTGALSIRTKTGVYGQANHGTAGIGVRGHSSTGTGVYASSTTGTSLRATGRVVLDKCSGITTILVGQKSTIVSPGIDLVSTSAIVATLMGSAGATTTVHRVAVNPTTNEFTIILTANNAAASPVKVAWHVFG